MSNFKKRIKDFPWGAIIAFVIVPLLGIVLITLHTAWEHDDFGDGSCHACQTGHYELFDIEHLRNSGELYYYRCNECHDIIRYESYQGG